MKIVLCTPATGPQTGPDKMLHAGGRGQASVRHMVSGHIPSIWDHLFTRFQKCWKAEELVTLTMISSSRYRNIMIMNQWLDNQESWLEALPGGRECW